MAKDVYKDRLDKGVAREQARKDLPLSTYTEAIWKCDLRNLMNFLQLRLDSHAQLEIRAYAQRIYDIAKIWVPWTMEAFNNHVLHSMQLSVREQVVLKLMYSSSMDATKCLMEYGWIREINGKIRSSREYREFEEKLGMLGITLQ